MESAPVLDALHAHIPYDDDEAAHVARVLEFVTDTPAPFSRTTPAGHVTGSAVLLDRDGTRMLLLLHAKLGRWLQPGGHCEPGIDSDPPATALRELLEETGVPVERLAPGARLFDVDVHTIPARGAEPAHDHHDLRYRFRLTEPWEPDAPCRWVPLTEAATWEDRSIARLAKKALGRG